MTGVEMVHSADGTSIAFERTGTGAPLVLVEPCGHYRDLSAFSGLRSQLAGQYTVYSYDRRGRGASSDAAVYAPEREVEDLAALIATADSPVFVYGYSSGALLALLAAARPLPVAKLALLEPPIREPGAAPDPLTAELAALVAEGRFSDVVEHFHRSIGVPDEYIVQMRATPAFAKMTAVAHTFVYDCRISDAITSAQLATVETPTLVLDSAGSTNDLTRSAATVARLLPRGSHRSLPGQWHSVEDGTLAAALRAFFSEDTGA